MRAYSVTDAHVASISRWPYQSAAVDHVRGIGTDAAPPRPAAPGADP
jgi:hypothetical protein